MLSFVLYQQCFSAIKFTLQSFHTRHQQQKCPKTSYREDSKSNNRMKYTTESCKKYMPKTKNLIPQILQIGYIYFSTFFKKLTTTNYQPRLQTLASHRITNCYILFICRFCFHSANIQNDFFYITITIIITKIIYIYHH